MKVTCVREKIKEVVSQAERIVGKNVSLPILSSILLKTDINKLIVRATNLDVGVEFHVPAKIIKEGEVAIPASIAGGIFSSIFFGKNVDLELVNDNLVVSTDKNTTLIKSFKSDDFPTIPKIKDGNTFSTSIKNITTGVKSVWYAAAISDIKPEISSVYIYKDKEDIIFVSTDSFRLAEKKIKDKNISEFKGVIVPVKNIHEIIRILETFSGECEVSINDNQISFSTEDMFITSRIINGVYPDYKQILPTKFTSHATVLKEDVVNALKLTNVFTDKFNKINIKADAGRNSFEISSQDNNIGENMAVVDATIDGDSFDINFNYKYIFDGLQAINQDSVTIKYDNKHEVMIMQGVSDPTFIYLVKPMNK